MVPLLSCKGFYHFYKPTGPRQRLILVNRWDIKAVRKHSSPFLIKQMKCVSQAGLPFDGLEKVVHTCRPPNMLYRSSWLCPVLGATAGRSVLQHGSKMTQCTWRLRRQMLPSDNHVCQMSTDHVSIYPKYYFHSSEECPICLFKCLNQGACEKV